MATTTTDRATKRTAKPRPFPSSRCYRMTDESKASCPHGHTTECLSNPSGGRRTKTVSAHTQVPRNQSHAQFNIVRCSCCPLQFPCLFFQLQKSHLLVEIECNLKFERGKLSNLKRAANGKIKPQAPKF